MQTKYIFTSPSSFPRALEQRLPPDVTQAVLDSGAPATEEIRLHADRFSSVKCGSHTYITRLLLSPSRMQEILLALCNGSLYAYGESIRQGYLSPCEGVRVGVCGKAATENGRIIGVSNVTSLIIRVPHAVEVNVSPITQQLRCAQGCGGILVYAPPGVGKTTLLRAVTAEIAAPPYAVHTVVVDTREELCYTLMGERLHLCVLSAYPRKIGIEIAVRSLGAQLIVCDEIGNAEDVDAILSAANCGVPLLASAHAASLCELLRRPAMKALHAAGVFRCYVGIRRGKLGFDYTFTTHGEADKQPYALQSPKNDVGR